MYGKFTEILDTADAFYALFHDNLEHCGIDETFKAITTKCFSSNSACSIDSFVKNFKKNWMRIVQGGNSVANVLMGWYEGTIDIITDLNGALHDFGSGMAELITSLFDI